MKARHLFATAVLTAAVPAAHAAPFTLDFENIDPTYPDFVVNEPLVDGYYAGGTASNGRSGTNFGATFVSPARVLCLNTVGTVCSNASKGGMGVPGSQRSGVTFMTTGAVVDVAAGFDTGFGLAYANVNPGFTGGFQIWSGLGGTGLLLAAASLPATPDGAVVCAAYGAPDYCPFSNFAVAFAGIGRSVVFTGRTDAEVFDDLTFGSTDVGLVGGSTSVAEPDTLALAGIALCVLGLARRRKGSPQR